MHEIMTIEEVAKYLRVSERTVYDWAQKGVIPGGKIGTTWRFKYSDIQKWVNNRLNKGEKFNKNQQNIIPSLIPERVLILESSSKQEVLNDLVHLLTQSSLVNNNSSLKKGIFERESIMSTGIGFGIAIPHVRSNAVDDIILSVAICKNGILDYESLDQKPVQIICMLAARSDQHKEYLRMLSAISTRLKESSVRKELLNTLTKKRVCELLLD